MSRKTRADYKAAIEQCLAEMQRLATQREMSDQTLPAGVGALQTVAPLQD